MRWVFFTLLTANLVYFAWQMVLPDKPGNDSPVKNRNSDINTIFLLSEAEDLAEPAEAYQILAPEMPEPEPVDDNVVEVTTSNGLCDAVGPFFDRDQGQRLVDLLGTLDVGSEIQYETLESTSKYWVYVEPQASLADSIRMKAELSSKGIESFLIGDGEHKNGLTIGVFGNEANAKGVQERLMEMDVAAEIEEKKNEIREYWVLLTEQKFDSAISEKNQQIREFTFENQVIQKVCKPVASLQSFN